VIPAILTALSALFGAVGKLFEFLYARQMVDAGKVQERLNALRKQVKDAQIAVAAREAIRAANAGGVSIDDKDPFIRD